MMSFVSLMWATALFFAVTGAVRGWQRELIGTTGIVLGFFAILQFDSLLRGSVYLLLTNGQIFLLQALTLIGLTLLAYRARFALNSTPSAGRLRKILLGGLAGFVNGYLMAGSIWYFLDINRYPFPHLITAPVPGSPSYQGIAAMPAIALGGGLAGNGDLLSLAILVLLAIVVLIV